MRPVPEFISLTTQQTYEAVEVRAAGVVRSV